MNVAALLTKAARTHPRRPALTFGGRQDTYEAFRARASSLAGGLRGEMPPVHLVATGATDATGGTLSYDRVLSMRRSDVADADVDGGAYSIPPAQRGGRKARC